MPLSTKDREILLSRISPVEDIPRKYKIVLFGPPGVGKTVLSAEIGGKSFMLASEPGFTVLTKPEHKHLESQVEKAPFTSLQGMNGYTELISDGTIPVDTYILDNFSGIQDKVLATNHKNPKVQSLARAHPDLSTLQDYQIVAHQMREPIISLLEMEANVIMVCHARFPTPELIAKGETTRPDLTKKVFDLVNEKADVVAYMYKDSKKRRLIQTISDSNITAKSRITPEGIYPVEEFIQQMHTWQPNTK